MISFTEPSHFSNSLQQKLATITTDEVLWQGGVLRWSYSLAIS